MAEKITHGGARVNGFLRCPTCGDSLDLGAHPAGWTGVLPCSCGGTAVVCGIVVSRNAGDVYEVLIDAARRGDVPAARERLIGKFEARFRGNNGSLKFRQFIRHGSLTRAVESPVGTWVADRFAGNRVTQKVTAAVLFNQYLRYRFSTPSFQATLPLLAMLPQEGTAPVLDAGCGMGHLSFSMSKIVGEGRVVSADINGAHAFAAREFFVPGEAAAVKADLGKPWPFREGAFGGIICLDAFPYIPDKALATREMMRVIRDDGFVALAHLFNGLSPSRFAHGALSPAQYADLFAGYAVRLFPEEHFAAAQHAGGPLDLTVQFSEETLRSSEALVLVAGKSADIFRVYPSVREKLAAAASHVELSELYLRQETSEGVVFRRRVPKAFLKLHQLIERELPERVVVHGRAAMDPQERRRLLKDGVMVDLPERF